MNIMHFYFLFSVVAVLLGENFFPIFRQSYSWWLVPVLILGIFLLLVLIQFICFGLMLITTNTKKKPGIGEGFFRFLLKHSLPVIVWVARVHIRASGLEKLPEDKGRMLFVCNHQHDFDPAVLFYCFPKAKLSFIGKKDIEKTMKLVAKIIHRLKCLYIDRENDREAAKTIITAIKMLKDQTHSIALFPEGYVSADDEVLPLRNGSLKTALKSKVPVVVCVINNTKQIPKRIFKKTTTVDFRLVEVIYPETYENMTTTELGDIIHEMMVTNLAEMKEERITLGIK